MKDQADAVKQLAELVESAIISAPPRAMIRELAAELIEDNRALIDGLMEEWRIEYVSRLLRATKARIAEQQRSSQLLLPGFDRLPQTVILAEGGHIPLGSATYRQLQRYLARLRERHNQSTRIVQVQALMDLMRKWRQKLRLVKGQPLTVAEVMEREAKAAK